MNIIIGVRTRTRTLYRSLPCTGVQNEQSPINSPGKAQKTGLATGVDHYQLLVHDHIKAESPQYLSALRGFSQTIGAGI